jgi:hypothetical protein
MVRKIQRGGGERRSEEDHSPPNDFEIAPSVYG